MLRRAILMSMWHSHRRQSGTLCAHLVLDLWQLSIIWHDNLQLSDTGERKVSNKCKMTSITISYTIQKSKSLYFDHTIHCPTQFCLWKKACTWVTMQIYYCQPFATKSLYLMYKDIWLQSWHIELTDTDLENAGRQRLNLQFDILFS